MNEDNKLRLFAVGILILVGIMVKFFYDNDKITNKELTFRAKYLLTKDNTRR